MSEMNEEVMKEHLDKKLDELRETSKNIVRLVDHSYILDTLNLAGGKKTMAEVLVEGYNNPDESKVQTVHEIISHVYRDGCHDGLEIARMVLGGTVE